MRAESRFYSLMIYLCPGEYGVVAHIGSRPPHKG